MHDETVITIKGPVQVVTPNATTVPPSHESTIAKISYGLEEAAAATSISVRKLREYIQSGDLITHRNGRDHIILHDDLVAFVQSLPLSQETA